MLTEILPTTTLPPVKLPATEKPKEFNWLTVLQELIDGRQLNPGEHFDLATRAMSWPKCACGQLCKLLPKRPDGRPDDKFLEDWGVAFYGAIVQREWSNALNIFNLIEERTALLLKEMGVGVC